MQIVRFLLASFPGSPPPHSEGRGEREPGTHCLHMHQIAPEKWGNWILSSHVRDTMM